MNEQLLKFEAKEFAKILSSLDQFIRAVKDQNNVSHRTFFQLVTRGSNQCIGTIKMPIGKTNYKRCRILQEQVRK